MDFIKKALQWAYGDSLRYIAFLLFLFVTIAFIDLLLMYPWQVILTIVGGFGLYVAFIFFDEIGKK